MTASRKRGRPKKLPEAGKRVYLGLRTTTLLKSVLTETARVNGRSISQEAELRLERSLEHATLFPEVLELAYGRDTAGLLLAMAAVMSEVGREAAFTKGGRLGARAWFDDPYGFDQAVNAVHSLLEAARPPGEPVGPQLDWIGSAFETDGTVVGEMQQYEKDRPSLHVTGLLEAIAGDTSKPTYQEDAARIRSLNSKIVTRLVPPPSQHPTSGDEHER